MEEGFLKDLIRLRKELHTYPELSQFEFGTLKRVKDFLQSHNLRQLVEVGGTGLLCTIDSGNPGPEILIRGDMDALPIEEVNEFGHKSIHHGVSHKCGHDGHTAILCGLAIHLQKRGLKSGKVILVFQPAEENGEGAKAILNDDQFGFTPDYVFALHNLPGYPLHEIVYRNGFFTAAARSIIVKLLGKTSHAAEPELGHNPATAISEIIQVFEKLSNKDLSSDEFALATPIHIHMGELAYGVSAGYGEVHYTLRSWSNQVMNQFSEKCVQEISVIAESYNLKAVIDWTQEFAANKNDPKAVEHIVNAADQNRLDKTERPYPFKWGEDFGLFTKKYKGAMFGVGSGEKCPALHNPDYDFPDELIPTGINMFTSIIEDILE